MYDPVTIANYFVQKGIDANEPITQMKVQKLVYISHGWYLALTGKPLINSVVEAWKFGPVIPKIYHTYKSFGNSPIAWQFPIEESIAKKDKDFLDSIWRVYGKYTAVYLSSLTHQKDTPWDNIARKFSYKIPQNKDIEDSLIENHYKKLKDRLTVVAS